MLNVIPKQLIQVFAVYLSVLSSFPAAHGQQAVSHFEPRIVKPTLDNSDVVVADLVITDKAYGAYGADPTGVKDCTATVQKAIEDLSKTGGGVLYFPAGKYRFSGTLTLHPGVTLKGDWASPLKGGSGKGTIFMVYSGKGDEKGKPFIQTRRGPSAIKNLSFWYPGQNAENPVPYPPTILRESLPGIMMKVTFYNAWIGYEVLHSGGSPLISEVYGTFLKKGIQGDICFEYGFFDRIYISPEIWADAPVSSITNAPKDKKSRRKLVDWCRKNTVGLEFLKNDNVEIFHVTVKDAKVGIYYGKHTGKLRKGGLGSYGFRMKVDAKQVFDHVAPWVGDVKDIGNRVRHSIGNRVRHRNESSVRISPFNQHAIIGLTVFQKHPLRRISLARRVRRLVFFTSFNSGESYQGSNHSSIYSSSEQ
jgi:hypothetical protein